MPHAGTPTHICIPPPCPSRPEPRIGGCLLLRRSQKSGSRSTPPRLQISSGGGFWTTEKNIEIWKPRMWLSKTWLWLEGNEVFGLPTSSVSIFQNFKFSSEGCSATSGKAVPKGARPHPRRPLPMPNARHHPPPFRTTLDRIEDIWLCSRRRRQEPIKLSLF